MVYSENFDSPLREFLNIFFKRIKLIVFVFAVTMCCGIAIVMLRVDTYEATAQILVKLSGNAANSVIGNENGPNVFIQHSELINSEVEIIKSHQLAENLVKNIGWQHLYPNLAKQKILKGKKDTSNDQLKLAMIRYYDNLRVSQLNKSNIIEIAFKHTDPKKAALVVNELAKLYIEKHINIHKTNNAQEFFEKQTGLLRSEILAIENNLKQIKEENKITSFEDQKRLLLNQESKVRMEYDEALSRKAETENRLTKARQQLERTPEVITKDSQVDQNQILIDSLESRLVELELKEKELLDKYTPENRLVTNVTNEIKIVKEKLADNSRKKVGRETSGVNPVHQYLQEEILRNESEYRAVDARLKNLSTQLENYATKLKRLNDIEFEYVQLIKQHELNHQNLQMYMTRAEESRISAAMDTEKISNVSIVENASIPITSVGPPRLIFLLSSLIIGVFGSTILALLTEVLTKKIDSADDIERNLNIPVLATVPKVK